MDHDFNGSPSNKRYSSSGALCTGINTIMDYYQVVLNTLIWKLIFNFLKEFIFHVSLTLPAGQLALLKTSPLTTTVLGHLPMDPAAWHFWEMILLPQPLPPPPQQLPMTTQLLLGQIRRPPQPVVRQDAEVLSGPTTSTVTMKTITPAATGTEGLAVTTASKNLSLSSRFVQIKIRVWLLPFGCNISMTTLLSWIQVTGLLIKTYRIFLKFFYSNLVYE